MQDLAVTWRGRGFEQKKLYERHPLIFAEKSPHKILCINLETPRIMRLLVRDLYIDLVITPSENSSLFNARLQLKYWRHKKMLMCIFIGNLIIYRLYLNNFFVSVLVAEI